MVHVLVLEKGDDVSFLYEYNVVLFINQVITTCYNTLCTCGGFVMENGIIGLVFACMNVAKSCLFYCGLNAGNSIHMFIIATSFHCFLLQRCTIKNLPNYSNVIHIQNNFYWKWKKSGFSLDTSTASLLLDHIKARPLDAYLLKLIGKLLPMFRIHYVN